MSVLVCDGVSLSYGTKEILNNVSFSLNAGVKLGVIGVNGAGKSTLAHIITGKIAPTSGSVFVPGSLTVGMLDQRGGSDESDCTVYERATAAFSALSEAERRLDDLLTRIPVQPSLVAEYESLRHDFEIKGGNEYKTKVKSMLARFGFPPDTWDFPVSLLSGGQKTRLALASLLVSGKDIVILDEPTNHLDIGTVEWLEGFICSSPATYIIISHDRYFLDRVTTETLEIENLTAVKYSGSYTAFKEKKAQLREIQQKHYELQQKEIRRLEAFIENQRKWNRERNIIAAESRQKAIDRIVREEKPSALPKTASMSVHTSAASYSVLSVRHLSKSYGTLHLFDDLSFDITRGERVMITGANGCGKSTLLKIIDGSVTPDSGICEAGYSQNVGYYDQEVQLLSEENTVIGELTSADPSLLPAKARSILASYGFVGEDAFKPVSVLSGGERARLSIAKLILRKVSFLMLDEPTNHLDIPSKEAFESALAEYEGTILAVSHDRYFISRLGTRIIDIDRDGYPDGYTDFRGSYSLFREKTVKTPVSRSADTSPREKPTRDAYEAEKKVKAAKRSAEKRFAFLAEEIPKTEKRIAELEAAYTLPEHASDYVWLAEADKESAALKELLDSMYDEYILLSDQAEPSDD